MNTIDLKEYKNICNILFISFFLNISFIITLNLIIVDTYLVEYFGYLVFELFKQFFYGAIGATIACVLFLAKDKEINEIESVKKNPDPKKLMLPDIIDKRLYILRIITSGILAIIGAIVILTGFSYLEIDLENGFLLKHKLLFALTSGLIGLYQFHFLRRIEQVFNSIFRNDLSDINQKKDLKKEKLKKETKKFGAEDSNKPSQI